MDALRFQAVAFAADAQIDEGWEMRCWVCQGCPLGNVVVYGCYVVLGLNIGLVHPS